MRRGVAPRWVPTRDQLDAARGKRVADLVAPRLRVLFCGINPGLYSGAVGHHFARPGNRFWTALHRAGFTDRLVSPFDERSLLQCGLGITNLVNRATARADELEAEDLRRGARRLARTARRYRPRVIAILGLGAYRIAFGVARASVGPREDRVGGARVWVLPSPSGRTAGYQIDALVQAFRKLRMSAERE
ncbi:MAG: G/U mismatch-specific DNA glycosylase [Candidatus Limnocylindria bacterium]